MIRRRKVDLSLERRLVSALATSSEFLGAARSHIDPDVIKSEHLRTITKWCLDYFDRYSAAPRENLEALYFKAVEDKALSDEGASAIQGVLAKLNGEVVNVAYLLDELRRYLIGRKLELLTDGISDSLAGGDVEGALADLQAFRAPTVGSGAGLLPLNDPKVWDFAFSEFQEPLINLGGDAGEFFAPALVREGFIGIQAPEKRGKTFWCLEFAFRALRERRRVALFSVGDLSERQILLRLGMRLTRKPMWRSQAKSSIKIPVSITWEPQDMGRPDVQYKDIRCNSSVRQDECVKEAQRFARTHALVNRMAFLVSTHPTWSINVQGIESILDGWEVEYGFVPDVVVIDYADILAPDSSRSSYTIRDQTNETWSRLRRLSQQRRCLVITATQANAASYDRETQSMRNFSEDKRKLAHVTGMLGLNQTEEEKEYQYMRLNWLLLREAPFVSRKCLFVGQCLPLGRALCCAAMQTRFVSQAVEYEDEPDEDFEE